MEQQPVAQPVRVNRYYIEILLAVNKASKTEIARMAHVHKWTVSRVLRNFRRVDPEKRAAVIRAIASRCECEIEEILLGQADGLKAA